MLSLPKLAIVSLVLVSIGALQFAESAFTGKQAIINLSQANEISPENPDVTLANQPISDYPYLQGKSTQGEPPQSGTLYFTYEKDIHEQGKQGHKVLQHALSPILNTQVDIKVTGVIARTKVTQTFKNASQDWVNGLYVFPLPENAAVDHLLMTVGERKIEGQIREKSVAKKIYQQAKAAGKKASLVAQLRSNMFSNNIANIGPGETVAVSIEYQQRLNFDKQQYSLRFPMTITPRYYPKGSPDKSQIHANVSESNHQPGNKIDLQLSLHAGFDVQDIHSEFHPITTKRLSDGSHHIQLSKGELANQDFVLNWRPELGAAPQSAHFTQQVNGDEYGLVMLLPPNNPEHLSQSQLRQVIFVLDTSGSMEGDSIKQAKAALLLAINQLQASDTFNVIEFNSYAQNLWKSPKLANSKNKQDAEYFVSNLSANGGTKMKSAFNLAFSQSQTNTQTGADNGVNENTNTPLQQIVFITDGSVGNEESLMELISHKLGKSRLFTVGIGSAPNSYFMREAAKMGRGTFTYIGSVDQVQEKILALLTKLQHPAITDIALQINSNPLHSNRQLEFYPNIISDLYLGEPLVLSYRLANSEIDSSTSHDYLSKVNISARYQDQPWKNNLQLSGQTRQSGLNVLWAREKISQLSRDKRRANMRSNRSASEQDEYKSQITQTALAHHLVSQYTSLVAVDVTPTRPVDIQAQDKKVPNQLPKGSSNKREKTLGRLPQTATPAQLKIIIGLFLIGLTICMRLLIKRKIAF